MNDARIDADRARIRDLEETKARLLRSEYDAVKQWEAIAVENASERDEARATIATQAEEIERLTKRFANYEASSEEIRATAKDARAILAARAAANGGANG